MCQRMSRRMSIEEHFNMLSVLLGSAIIGTQTVFVDRHTLEE